MTRLSVNVNKIATIRNSRGKNNPNVLQMALDIERFGAHGITVHPRPDERHIRFEDVRVLKKNISTELNVEGFPDRRFLDLINEVRPGQATLVPDPPDVLTSNAGWQVAKTKDLLARVTSELLASKTRVSIFIDPLQISKEELSWLKSIGVHRIELYTEAYAENFASSRREEVTKTYRDAALMAKEVGLEINAGHDLSLENLQFFVRNVPNVAEVSIGHALISDALYLGMQETIRRYLACLEG